MQNGEKVSKLIMYYSTSFFPFSHEKLHLIYQTYQISFWTTFSINQLCVNCQVVIANRRNYVWECGWVITHVQNHRFCFLFSIKHLCINFSRTIYLYPDNYMLLAQSLTPINPYENTHPQIRFLCFFPHLFNYRNCEDFCGLTLKCYW